MGHLPVLPRSRHADGAALAALLPPRRAAAAGSSPSSYKKPSPAASNPRTKLTELLSSSSAHSQPEASLPSPATSSRPLRRSGSIRRRGSSPSPPSHLALRFNPVATSRAPPRFPAWPESAPASSPLFCPRSRAWRRRCGPPPEALRPPLAPPCSPEPPCTLALHRRGLTLPESTPVSRRGRNPSSPVLAREGESLTSGSPWTHESV